MRRPNIAVGDEVPPLVRTPGFAEWNRFAAVNHEFVPIHMDDNEGRRAGYDRAIGMGRLQWSYLHTMLRAWLSRDGRIVSVSAQFRAPNLRGAEVRAQGRVTAVRQHDGQRHVDLEVWIEDGHGNVMVPGRATVELFD